MSIGAGMVLVVSWFSLGACCEKNGRRQDVWRMLRTGTRRASGFRVVTLSVSQVEKDRMSQAIMMGEENKRSESLQMRVDWGVVGGGEVGNEQKRDRAARLIARLDPRLFPGKHCAATMRRMCTCYRGAAASSHIERSLLDERLCATRFELPSKAFERIR
jgi:hypothetical protein